MKSCAAYILIAHGSRESEANEAHKALAKRFAKLKTGSRVYASFLELAKPSIPEALKQAASSGAVEIFIVPLMFFSGRHVKQDVPRFIEEAKAKYPEADFHYAGPLADHPLMLKLIDGKAKSLVMKSKKPPAKR